MQQAAGPREVLREERSIQAQLLADGRDVVWRRAEPEHRLHRIAGNEVDHQEHEDAHHDDHGDRQEQAADDEPASRTHGSPAMALILETSWRMTVSVKRK